MSNHNYPRRLLDDAIDRAVNELVQAEPRPGFRRRVMTKVNAPTRRSAWAVRFLVPAGAMAAVVLIALWLRPPASSSTATPQTQVAEQRPVPAAPQTQARPATSPSAAPAPAKPRSSPIRRQPPVQFSFGPPNDRVAATSITDRVSAPSVAPEAADETTSVLTELPAVRISPIEIRPILVRPIELKPIGVGSSSTPQ